MAAAKIGDRHGSTLIGLLHRTVISYSVPCVAESSYKLRFVGTIDQKVFSASILSVENTANKLRSGCCRGRHCDSSQRGIIFERVSLRKRPDNRDSNRGQHQHAHYNHRRNRKYWNRISPSVSAFSFNNPHHNPRPSRTNHA